MKSVGIDIGAASIKVVEVTANTKGQLRITQFIDHPLGQNPAFDPQIEIIEFLKGLAASYDPTTIRFVMGLRQDQVSVRHKVFPFNDRLKIQKSLPFELEEDLPFSSDSAIFDAKMIRTRGHNAEVLACATPKHSIADFLKQYGDLGFDIDLLSAEGLAFANCYEKWFDPPAALPPSSFATESNEKPPCVLNLVVCIGHTRTLVTAFDNGQLVGVRSILWGGKNVAEAISRRYEIPYVEALKEMQTKAFILPHREGASYDQIVFSDTISSQYKDLARDLKISILEFMSELNAQISNVGLTGGASQVLNLQAFMTQMLELPVNRTSVLSGFSALNFEATAKIDATIGVALGLAIEGVKKPRNPAVQFLRGEFAHQNHYLKMVWQQWGRTLQFAAALYVTFFVYSAFRENVAQNLSDRTYEAMKSQAKAVAHLPSKQANESGVKKYIREQKKRAQDLKTLSSISRMNSALDILKKVSDATPPKSEITLDVKRWSIEENRALLEGSVKSPAELNKLTQNLSNVAVDGKVERLAPTVPAPAGSVAFSLSFTVDRGITK